MTLAAVLDVAHPVVVVDATVVVADDVATLVFAAAVVDWTLPQIVLLQMPMARYLSPYTVLAVGALAFAIALVPALVPDQDLT